MRERWFGATGRRVPALAVDGDPAVALGEALVLDGAEVVDRLVEAHRNGTPVVVRAESSDAVRAALARPEVSSVVVPEERRELLELDLTALTYG